MLTTGYITIPTILILFPKCWLPITHLFIPFRKNKHILICNTANSDTRLHYITVHLSLYQHDGDVALSRNAEHLVRLFVSTLYCCLLHKGCCSLWTFITLLSAFVSATRIHIVNARVFLVRMQSEKHPSLSTEPWTPREASNVVCIYAKYNRIHSCR